jgi:hypothetical protein
MASGRKDDSPGLAACFKDLRDGDTMRVSKLDRIGEANTLEKLEALLPWNVALEPA